MNMPKLPTRLSLHMTARHWLTVGLIVGLLAFGIVFPQLMGRDNVWNLFFLICLGVAMGQSWNILGGFAGQTSLGHAAFFGIGALVARVLWLQGVPFVAAFVVGGLAAAVFAMIIGAPTFRLRGAYFAIGTLAVAEALRITFSQNLPYISTMSSKTIATYNLPERYWVALALAVATTAVASRMLRFTFEALMIAYIGGLGTVSGPVIGAIFFVVVRERLAASLTGMHQVIFGALFVLVVLLLPGGLMEIWGYLKRFMARFAGRHEQPAEGAGP
jgi:ABC-type branched-subunit amino acid transport system permease subunit